jgi:large subunit ribosomal protein L24
MAKFKIQRDDQVVIIAGKHKGKIGKVLRVITDDAKVVVEKVNLVKRQVKPQGGRPGGTVEKEAPIHVSNVALWDAEAGSKVKVGRKILGDGTKVRVNKATGDQITRD